MHQPTLRIVLTLAPLLLPLLAMRVWGDETDCGDKLDNDGDGAVDCADLDCCGWFPGCMCPRERCDNLIDDDLDGRIDCADSDCAEVPCGEPHFKRGDSNGDRNVDISDAIRLLEHLFLGGGALPCQDAADADDSGDLLITDALYVLDYLFLSGPPPPWPHGRCGPEFTHDMLSCDTWMFC